MNYNNNYEPYNSQESHSFFQPTNSSYQIISPDCSETQKSSRYKSQVVLSVDQLSSINHYNYQPYNSQESHSLFQPTNSQFTMVIADSNQLYNLSRYKSQVVLSVDQLSSINHSEQNNSKLQIQQNLRQDSKYQYHQNKLQYRNRIPSNQQIQINQYRIIHHNQQQLINQNQGQQSLDNQNYDQQSLDNENKLQQCNSIPSQEQIQMNLQKKRGNILHYSLPLQQQNQMNQQKKKGNIQYQNYQQMQYDQGLNNASQPQSQQDQPQAQPQAQSIRHSNKKIFENESYNKTYISYLIQHLYNQTNTKRGQKQLQTFQQNDQKIAQEIFKNKNFNQKFVKFLIQNIKNNTNLKPQQMFNFFYLFHNSLTNDNDNNNVKPSFDKKKEPYSISYSPSQLFMIANAFKKQVQKKQIQIQQMRNQNQQQKQIFKKQSYDIQLSLKIVKQVLQQVKNIKNQCLKIKQVNQQLRTIKGQFSKIKQINLQNAQHRQNYQEQIQYLLKQEKIINQKIQTLNYKSQSICKQQKSKKSKMKQQDIQLNNQPLLVQPNQETIQKYKGRFEKIMELYKSLGQQFKQKLNDIQLLISKNKSTSSNYSMKKTKFQNQQNLENQKINRNNNHLISNSRQKLTQEFSNQHKLKLQRQQLI